MVEPPYLGTLEAVYPHHIVANLMLRCDIAKDRLHLKDIANYPVVPETRFYSQFVHHKDY